MEGPLSDLPIRFHRDLDHDRFAWVVGTITLLVTGLLCVVGALHLAAPGWFPLASAVATRIDPLLWAVSIFLFLGCLPLRTPWPKKTDPQVLIEIGTEGVTLGRHLVPWHAIGKVWIEDVPGDADTEGTRLLKIQTFPWTPPGEPHRETSWFEDVFTDGTTTSSFDARRLKEGLETILKAIEAHRPKETP